jgi:hypothetical protein
MNIFRRLNRKVLEEGRFRSRAALFEGSLSEKALVLQLLQACLALGHVDSGGGGGGSAGGGSEAKPRGSFELTARPSTLPSGAGLGLFLHGHVGPGTLVTLYPGTLYSLGNPLFFQSFLNRFLLRLNGPGATLDGSDASLSASLFTSMATRDAYLRAADRSWLEYRREVMEAVRRGGGDRAGAGGTEEGGKAGWRDWPRPANPLAMGHFANHYAPLEPHGSQEAGEPCGLEQSGEPRQLRGPEKPPGPNLAYISFRVPSSFPLPLSRFIPNVHYDPEAYFSGGDDEPGEGGHVAGEGGRRSTSTLITCVGLVAMREACDEELFVDYGFVGAAPVP